MRFGFSHKLEEYEGCVVHMYLDTNGFVTVGVGHMIPNVTEARRLHFWSSDKQVATEDEKKAEYETISKEPRGKAAGYYKQKAKLYMKQPDIDTLTRRHIESFERELRSIYAAPAYAPGFDNYPIEVRLALFDMIFNLGMPKLKSTFPIFNAAISKQDGEAAGKGSRRAQLSRARNDYVRDLLQRAADAKKQAK